MPSAAYAAGVTTLTLTVAPIAALGTSNVFTSAPYAVMQTPIARTATVFRPNRMIIYPEE